MKLSGAGKDERALYFVYGTLKRGFPNENQIPKSATYVGEALTKQPFPLVVDTEYHVPFMIDSENYSGAKRVFGELILVDRETRKTLDQFEGVDTGFYFVKPIEVVISQLRDEYEGELSDGQTVVANVYFRDPSNAGPSWAHKWTVERLLTLPSTDAYMVEMGKRYTSRTHRS
ncbi:Gamma-glutamylcyclotransferase AIG2-like protein [Gracilaria domingensis]|nr:Gamma-glutamylcyclotransferase AIG2-like protein [Gracilaria domingensis]